MSHEIRVLAAIQRRTGAPAAVRAARALSLAGEHAGAWLALAGAGAVVDRPRRASWLRAGAAVLVSHGASVVLKRVVRRVRPEHASVLTQVGVPSRWSFPSSHATSTTTAALVLAPLLGGRAWAALPPAMAWSRLLLGVHYPSDVLAGTALGALVGAASRRLEQR